MITNTLPIHPYSGLRALAVLPSGRPVWPVMGGAVDDGGDGKTSDNGDGGEGQGDGGQSRTFSQDDVDRVVEQRLARERAKYADYDQHKAAAAELEKLRESQASDAEKAVTQARKDTEAQVRGELEPRLNRLEVALRVGLPDDLGAKVLSAAKRLVGATPEELEADAKEFFATAPINPPPTSPRVTYDQGARRGGSDTPSVARGAELYARRHGNRT